MKKYAFYFVAFLLWSFTTPVSANNPITLRILHFNDIYEVAAQKDPTGQNYGGFAELKTLIDQKKQGSKYSLITFGGDLFPASIDGASLAYQDQIKLANQLGIEAAVLGNHEFDYGPETAIKITEISNFPWIIDNITYKDKPGIGKTIPYKIFIFENYKIAIIGFLLPESRDLSYPGPNVKISNAIEKAKPLVAKLKKEGADIIIALTHQSLKEDQDLLKEVPEIDLILGGHEHRPITYFVNQKQMIFKTGYDAHYLGILDLKMERYKNAQGEHIYLLPSWEMIPVRNVAPDPTIQKFVQALKANLPQDFFAPLITLEEPLDSRRSQIYSRQTSMGTLITNALKKQLGTEVAIINSGSIRGDHLYPKGATLSQQNINQELPFEDSVMTGNISGMQLKQWIENSLDEIENPNGSFLQTAGVSYSLDRKAFQGNRAQGIKINGKPLELKKNYTIATVDYLSSGKDGFAKLTNIQNTHQKPCEIVIRFLENLKKKA